MTFKPTGRKEQKLQVMQSDMDNILAYITANGPTSRDELLRQCKISVKQISHRLKKLQEIGKIQSIRYGTCEQTGEERDRIFINSRYGAVWALGKQQKVKKDIRPRAKRADQRDRSLNLTELPPLLQKWLAYVPGFEPAKGRIIHETMPDIPIRKAQYHIGSGTSAHIDMLVSG